MSHTGKPGAPGNEPFVAQSDRPTISPTTRVADMTVQDLLTAIKTTETFKTQKQEHVELKIHQTKWEHPKSEHPKWEFIKWEHAKAELWKVEHVEVVTGPGGIGPDPGPLSGIAQGMSELKAQVESLSSEVAQLRKAGKG